MKSYFFRKTDSRHIEEFRSISLHHNMRISRAFAAIISVVTLVLYIMYLYTDTEKVLLYPAEYAAAISFLFIASVACYALFLASKILPQQKRIIAYRFLGYLYALVILIASLWITFVMQHNPSNTMSIFVLGILTVAALWIFEEHQAIIIALLIVLLFNGGLRYFQTDPCKLFTNYITGTCVSIFFVCISRITFSVNYNHFEQLKKIEQNKEDMCKVNAMQTEILGVVAHDLHAPINNVITIIDILRHPGTTNKERDEYYDMMLTTCQRSDAIIDELLSVARDEERDARLASTNLGDFIKDAVSQYIMYKDSSAHITFLPPGEQVFAMVNKQKLMRVMDNLLSNAIKFTPGNGVINVELHHCKDQAHIVVRDNGVGIPKDLLPHLFSRFSRAGRQGLLGQKSYGLGLSICKLIMNQHHGDIAAASNEGEGTTITLTLPTAAPPTRGGVFINALLLN